MIESIDQCKLIFCKFDTTHIFTPRVSHCNNPFFYINIGILFKFLIFTVVDAITHIMI